MSSDVFDDYRAGYLDGRRAAARDVRSLPARKWGDWLFRRAAAKVAEHGRTEEGWARTFCFWCDAETTGRRYYCMGCGARVADRPRRCLRNTEHPCRCEICERGK